MKKIFISLLLLLLHFMNYGQSDHEIRIDPDPDHIFDNQDSLIRKKATSLNGADTSYYGNGKIRSIEKYKNGVLFSQLVFYANGNIWYENNYSDSIIDGVQIEWWANGTKKSYHYYNSGKEIDGGREWDDKGKLKSETHIEGSLKRILTFYESGEKESEYFTDQQNILTGLGKYFCKNGQLVSMINYDQETSVREFYHCNGNLWKKGKMKFNLFWIGDYSEYYENGNIKIKGSYSDISKNEEKTGEWKYFNENGKLTHIEVWRNGILLKEE